MADLSVASLIEVGLDVPYVAADVAGDAFVNDGNIMLMVENADASAHTVTVTAQQTVVNSNNYGKLDKADAVHSVPAGGTAILGPFSKAMYNDVVSKVQVTYDAVTSMSVAAVHK